MKNTEENIVQELSNNGFNIARMISYSKSTYRDKYPNNIVLFNANLIDKKLGKIWHGDLDITKDSLQLKNIANKFNTVFYILSEMDGRFENENKSIKELIKVAKWNTDQETPIYDKDFKIVPYIISEKQEIIGAKNVKKSGLSKLVVPLAAINKWIRKNKLPNRKIKKIEMAPTDKADEYQKEIDVILKCLGHEEALVSDMSNVYDFCDIFGSKKDNEKIVKKLNKKLGIEVKEDDLIIDVAKKMRQKKS